MVKIDIIIYLVLIIGSAAVGGLAGYSYRKKISDAKIEQLNNAESRMKLMQSEAEKIITEAKREAKALKKEIEIKAKDDIYKMKDEAEKEVKASKKEIQAKEQKIEKKEENLDKKIEKVESRDKEIDNRYQKLEKREEEIEVLIKKGQEELERVSGLSQEEAKDILLSQLEDQLTHESAVLIKEYDKRLEEDKERIYRRVISTAIAKGASEYVVESTVSVVHLPNDEMKGRIIGREGRNIRTIEALSGVDLIIDDTPEAVVISSFDSVRREIAKIAVEKLVQDGRIHPAKIEEAIEKAKKEVNLAIIEAGEQALLELGIPGMNNELLKTLGKLRYRTSYGQNILTHSIEVAHLAGVMASEIGVDVVSAKRAGLLHDIGKALDHEIEGSHAVIGADFLKKYKEKPKILNAVAAHHGDEEFGSIEAILVQAADALSASRPGARRETLETYLKRLEGLEKIANTYKGVETAFAIQAGRELRIIVRPEEIDDDASIKMSRDISKQVEANIQYPGQIKVTVVRETRAVDYAK